MKSLVLLISTLLISISISAQTNDCLSDFDYLVKKIEADYPGYSDKVTSETANELHALEQQLREKINLYPDSCRTYLNQYVTWFRDYHLRIHRKWHPKNSTAGEKEQSKPRYVQLTDETIQSLAAKDGSVEGIWQTFRGKIAILNQPGDEKFYGIAIQYAGYEPNQVMFEFTLKSEYEFDLISFPDYTNFRPISGLASLRLDERILELHDNTRFVRQSGSEVSDKALLYSYLPEFPNGSNTYPLALSLTDSTFYLRIPSFMDDDSEILVGKHWKEITSRPNLIIDIRNNGGGQDNFYQPLAELIYSRPYESKGVEWYATPANIQFFQNALENGEIKDGEEGIRWTNILLDEMRKNMGGFVIHPMMGGDERVVRDTVYAYPRRVGIILNENNGSSAEQFLLAAKESDKVILFGNQNTAGVLDYSNAVGEDFPSGNYELTFPMTRSRRLPDMPIDNIGIAPDVLIPYPSTPQLYDRLDQWVYFVKNYLELMEE
ncbi:MAG: hypothetical protein IH596_03025 [Bacteroidales bacterium]|nr:hypothetical protein [Bacteroidales bacterium]